MQKIIFLLFLLMSVSAHAQQQSASQQLKEKFLSVLQDQVMELITEATKQEYSQDISQKTHFFMSQVEAAYGGLLNLPDAEAKQLLTVGPDDKANITAMQKDIELWKTIQLPMPALYQNMQQKVVDGKIKGGLELELVRRISEFHLRQLGKLKPILDSSNPKQEN